MIELDIAFVRSQFPAFKDKNLDGMSFFENAGGSFPAGAVVSRLNRFYMTRKVQPYAAYKASVEGGNEMDEARDRLSKLLNVKVDELHLGPSTSSNTYVLAQAFRTIKSKRDTIIVTNQDHEANSGAWRRLSRDGFQIKEWKVDHKTGQLSLNDLKSLLDDRVLLVAFPHCSNIVGEINPAKEICHMIRAHGALSCVDGVSYVPHGFPDIANFSADIYLFSSYKTYGPHLGIMYISEKLNNLLDNQGHYFNELSPTKRFTPAGPDHAQVASLAGIADYVDAVFDHHFKHKAEPFERAQCVHSLQREHEKKILAPLLEYIKNRTEIDLVGSTNLEKRVPTVSLNLGSSVKDITFGLCKDGLMVDSGDFYAVRLLEALGISINHGVLRLSFVHYTSEQDVEKLIAALDKHIPQHLEEH